MIYQTVCLPKMQLSLLATKQLLHDLVIRIVKGKLLEATLGHSLVKIRDCFIDDFFSDTYTLSLSYFIPNSKCVSVAKEDNNKRVPHLTFQGA